MFPYYFIFVLLTPLRSMYVYFDNNIVIDYEEGKKVVPFVSEVNYVYSYTHLQEFLEVKENFDTRKDVRIQTIKRLTSNKYVSYNGKNLLSICEREPSEVFANVDSPLSKICSLLIHQATSCWLVDNSPKFLIDILKIEKKVINNYTPEMLFEKHGEIIKNYIASTSNSMQEEFQSFFNILDELGFWQDKVYKGSTMNRSYDANHAYFATSCDYFVTNDRNTRIKASAIYQLYGFKTQAVSYEDFILLVEKQ